MRENIKELKNEIRNDVGFSSSTIEYKPGTNASFIVHSDYGIDSLRLKKLMDICEKENMDIYICTKLFSGKVLFYLTEKRQLA